MKFLAKVGEVSAILFCMRLRLVLLLLVSFSLIPTTYATDLGRGESGDYLYIHHPPDPVNVRNGNFYLPAQDYFMACYGFPLEVYRSYNSVSTRNGPLGRGWTFNYDLQITVDERRGLTVVEADGFINEYTPVEDDLGAGASIIDVIVDARTKEDARYLKKPDGKGKAFYARLRTRLEKDEKFRNRQADRYLPKRNKISGSGKYISHERGTTRIEKTRNGFLRTTETGRKEEYNRRGLMVRLSDRNDNSLTLKYNRENHLDRVTDGCGQSLRFSYSKSGKIIKITDLLMRQIKYAYDKRDHLMSVATPDGARVRFTYDGKGLMTAIQWMDGAKTEIKYDKKTKYVVEQSGPGEKITKYTYGASPGKVWAKVTDNQGGKSRYEYLDVENKIIFTDRSGQKTITTVNACCGKPISITDAKGKGDTFTYNKKGNLISKTNAKKETMKFSYEPRFNLPNEIRLHDGSYLRFIYDKGGNLSLSRSSTGEHVQIVNERHGKIAKMTDHRDITINFEYNRFGKPILIAKSQKGKRVGSISIVYGKTGEMSRVTYEPKNPEVIQDIKKTLASFLRFLKPSGIDFEI